MKMIKPNVSERFDVEDIRRIREYNSLRHIQMTPAEIIEDTKKGAAPLMAVILNRNEKKRLDNMESKS